MFHQADDLFFGDVVPDADVLVKPAPENLAFNMGAAGRVLGIPDEKQSRVRQTRRQPLHRGHHEDMELVPVEGSDVQEEDIVAGHPQRGARRRRFPRRTRQVQPVGNRHDVARVHLEARREELAHGF